jgi:hypothetical protein
LRPAGVVCLQFDQAERESQCSVLAVALGRVGGEGDGLNAQPFGGCANDRLCLLECQAARGRFVGDAGRELGSERVEVDVQVDVADAARDVLDGGKRVAVGVSPPPVHYVDGGVLQAIPLGLRR